MYLIKSILFSPLEKLHLTFLYKLLLNTYMEIKKPKAFYQYQSPIYSQI